MLLLGTELGTRWRLVVKLKLLSSRMVDTAKPGKYADGGGLYLIVLPSGSRKWVFRYTRNGRAREMGVGGSVGASGANLGSAREQAESARAKIAKGLDPLDVRAREKAEATGGRTFAELAREVRESLSAGFRNEKHRAQWKMTLEVYAAPLAAMRVDEIQTDDVLACLKPIWTTKPETASRVRGRIEKVLDAAKAKKLRADENPARWRGHLDHLLPKPGKLTRGHHPAMSYKDVPGFVAELRQRSGVAALALEFAILTGGRSGEAMGARWAEIDLDAKVWTVPGSRMKAGRVHRVPLSGRALEIVKVLGEARAGEFVFPGSKLGKSLSVMALEMVLRRMNPKGIDGTFRWVDPQSMRPVTVHGFRSSFRDWAGNETSFPRELAEAALSHAVGDEVERAYRRGDALERRRDLMQAWANYCEPVQSGNVVQLGSSARTLTA
jgi:integrase